MNKVLLVILVAASLIGGAYYFVTFNGANHGLSGDIFIDTPWPNDIIASPLEVKGRARGTWFFEASAPVRVYDGNGIELGVAPMQAQGEWMTTDFVSFAGKVEFSESKTVTGKVVFQKDNPSGLPEYDKSYEVPVKFK